MEKRSRITSCIIAAFMLLSCNGAADIYIDNDPITFISGVESALDRPEGVAFSPDGKYVATANSLVNRITFYKRIGDQGSVYETIPSFAIQGKKTKLSYPHDIAFSPDGSHLAVANRKRNSITVYQKGESGDRYENEPIAVIQGESSGVVNPDSVRYSPNGDFLAVANKGNHSITFYRFHGSYYEQIPYQTITDSPGVISVPDSLDFSMDGELLAVTSHDNHAVLIYQEIPGSPGLYSCHPVQILQGAETNFRYPHSVCFHPTKKYLLVSNSEGLKNINIFQKLSEDALYYGSTPVLSLEVTQMYDASTIHLLEELQQEGGCKGVSFSPDGKSLAITQNLCADSMKLPFCVGVLLIYSVNFDD